jgi:hypothetical protein
MKVKIPEIIEKSKSYKKILAHRKLDYELSFEKYYLILFSKQRSLGPLNIFKIYSINSFLYHRDVAAIVFKVLDKNGVLNIGGVSQSVYKFEKT